MQGCTGGPAYDANRRGTKFGRIVDAMMEQRKEGLAVFDLRDLFAGERLTRPPPTYAASQLMNPRTQRPSTTLDMDQSPPALARYHSTIIGCELNLMRRCTPKARLVLANRRPKLFVKGKRLEVWLVQGDKAIKRVGSVRLVLAQDALRYGEDLVADMFDTARRDLERGQQTRTAAAD